MASTKTTHPPVVWGQKSNEVIATVTVPDIQQDSAKITINKDSISLDAKGKNGQQYAFSMELYDEVDPDKSKYLIQPRSTVFLLVKKDDTKPFWPRLHKENKKLPYVSVDWNRWVDEDGDADEHKDFYGGLDFGAGGRGGGGMGGMGGGGMGGMPDFSSMMGGKGMGGMGGLGGGLPGMDDEEGGGDDDGSGLGGMGGMGGMGGGAGGGGAGGATDEKVKQMLDQMGDGKGGIDQEKMKKVLEGLKAQTGMAGAGGMDSDVSSTKHAKHQHDLDMASTIRQGGGKQPASSSSSAAAAGGDDDELPPLISGEKK